MMDSFKNLSYSLFSKIDLSKRHVLIKISTVVAGAIMVSWFKFYGKNKKTAVKSKLVDIRPYCVECREKKIKNEESCEHGTGLQPLYDVLQSTEKSLDICMYIFTDKTIMKILFDKLKNGVQIRLIVDGEMAFANKSCVIPLYDAGVPVKWERSIHSMHNKYCIIDNKLVVTGSFNWTHQATNGNYENLLLTQNPMGIGEYCSAFNDLWQIYQPFDKEAIDLRALPSLASRSRN